MVSPALCYWWENVNREKTLRFLELTERLGTPDTRYISENQRRKQFCVLEHETHAMFPKINVAFWKARRTFRFQE